MKTLGDVLMLATSGALIPFPVVYHILTDGYWRRTAMGIHLMVFMAVLSEVMCWADANVLWGPLPEWIRPLLWFQIGVVSWWRLLILIQVQHYDREDDPGAEERVARER